MRWIAAWGMGLLLVTAASGCNLCRCKTECYADVIDDVSDHNIELDCLYCPALDLTRIGYPDWCACPLNAALDSCKCASNLPYYGPRNRTSAAYAAAHVSFRNSPPPEPLPHLPPVPPESPPLELPPVPAVE